MTSSKNIFISFKPQDKQFIGYISIEALSNPIINPATLLNKANKRYSRLIKELRKALRDIQIIKERGETIKARKIWNIGDIIFKFKHDLEKMSLELDGLYEHIVRDVGVKQKWLEKVITLRRYIPNEKQIPTKINWGRCEKGTRRVAEKIAKGISVEK